MIKATYNADGSVDMTLTAKEADTLLELVNLADNQVRTMTQALMVADLGLILEERESGCKIAQWAENL